MKTVCTVLVLRGLLVTMVGCNTVKGLGRDVEDVGDAMEDALN